MSVAKQTEIREAVSEPQSIAITAKKKKKKKTQNGDIADLLLQK